MDSLPHGRAAPERGKEVPAEVIYSQENRRRKRRRRRRRSKTRDTVLTANRRERQSNRNRAQYREKHRSRHNIRSNLAQKRKRTFGGGVMTALRERKSIKILSGRNRRVMQSRSGNVIRHRSTVAKSDGDFDYNEMSCIYIMGICIRMVLDFFWCGSPG